MNQKICRNKKHKYSNEEKFALVENENTSALINIAQEDDRNIFELLQNLGIGSLRFIILKTFKILYYCYCCFYFTFTLYTNVLNTVVFMIRKRKEKINLKANLSPQGY